MTDILDVMQAFSFPLKAAWSVWLVCGAGLLFWRIRHVRGVAAVTIVARADDDADAESFDDPTAPRSQAAPAYVVASAHDVPVAKTPAALRATSEAAAPLSEATEARAASAPAAITDAADVDRPAVDIAQFRFGTFEAYETDEGRRSKRRRRARAGWVTSAGGASGASRAGGASEADGDSWAPVGRLIT